MGPQSSPISAPGANLETSRKLRKERRHEPKALAGRYYQLLSGHTAAGDYFCNKVHRITSDKCCCCGRNKKRSRHHLFVRCEAWDPKPTTCGKTQEPLRTEASEGP